LKNRLKSKTFDVSLEGKYVIFLPESQVAPFIEKGHKRAEIIATSHKKQLTFHGALRKRNGAYQLMFSKQKQKELNLLPGDIFQLQLLEDTTKYGVEMPEELEAVFESDPEAFSIFKSFTDGKKRSLIYYIKRIKNIQTRVDKALLISENIKMGITDLRELNKVHR